MSLALSCSSRKILMSTRYFILSWMYVRRLWYHSDRRIPRQKQVCPWQSHRTGPLLPLACDWFLVILSLLVQGLQGQMIFHRCGIIASQLGFDVPQGNRRKILSSAGDCWICHSSLIITSLRHSQLTTVSFIMFWASRLKLCSFCRHSAFQRWSSLRFCPALMFAFLVFCFQLSLSENDLLVFSAAVISRRFFHQKKIPRKVFRRRKVNSCVGRFNIWPGGTWGIPAIVYGAIWGIWRLGARVCLGSRNLLQNLLQNLLCPLDFSTGSILMMQLIIRVKSNRIHGRIYSLSCAAMRGFRWKICRTGSSSESGGSSSLKKIDPHPGDNIASQDAFVSRILTLDIFFRVLRIFLQLHWRVCIGHR
jgi:hypothetical protein